MEGSVETSHRTPGSHNGDAGTEADGTTIVLVDGLFGMGLNPAVVQHLESKFPRARIIKVSCGGVSSVRAPTILSKANLCASPSQSSARTPHPRLFVTLFSLTLVFPSSSFIDGCPASARSPSAQVRDRACECFWQLHGGTVDYELEGACLEPGHGRWGGDEEGLVRGWGEDRPVVLVGYSLGAPTARYLHHLLAKGSFRRPDGTPIQTSARWVSTVLTINGVNNGTVAVHAVGLRRDTLAPMSLSILWCIFTAIYVIVWLDCKWLDRACGLRLEHWEARRKHKVSLLQLLRWRPGDCPLPSLSISLPAFLPRSHFLLSPPLSSCPPALLPASSPHSLFPLLPSSTVVAPRPLLPPILSPPSPSLSSPLLTLLLLTLPPLAVPGTADNAGRDLCPERARQLNLEMASTLQEVALDPHKTLKHARFLLFLPTPHTTHAPR